MEQEEKQPKTVQRRWLTGTVVSAAADKTVVVTVERKLRHKLYSKMYKRTKKYHAHDERNQFKVGDTVNIVASRPYSKLKKWRVVYSDEATNS